ncbi:helix-turn-helix domain-containing protein [Roseibium aestuarii]|uniref:Helix-turn-helix domain-containing protein n=1 Tax=Roseibium aestuarii TaxID=2600299 RepID=A0ABW4JTH1_9HYPH|nr:AraC family transcriptional regulator [Roseibium aestuarii]
MGQIERGGLIVGVGVMSVRSALKAAGHDWAALERKCGLDPAVNYGPEDLVSLRAFAAYHEAAAEIFDDEAFALRISISEPIGIASVFDYLALAAPTVDRALDNWIHYQRIPTTSINISREARDGRTYLIWELPDTIGPTAQTCGLIIGYSVTRLRRIFGENEIPLHVEFPHRAPANDQEFRRLLGPNVRFGCERLRLGFPDSALALKPQDSENNLLAIIERSALVRIQDQARRNDKVHQISTEISASLKEGDASVDAVARRLGMSRRALQRLLESSGTSFRALLDEVRQSLALRYLKESELQLSEIAYLLGYSELSAFSRAAKGWFGVPPLQVRQGTGSATADAVAQGS